MRAVADAVDPGSTRGASQSQERQTIVVPRGNRYGTLIRATRADFGGDLALEAEGLPAGVKMTAETGGRRRRTSSPSSSRPQPTRRWPASSRDLTAEPTGENKATVQGKFVQSVELVVRTATTPRTT